MVKFETIRRRIQKHEYYLINRNHILTQSRTWGMTHKDRRKATRRLRYLKNRELELLQTRMYYTAHKDQHRKWQREYWKKNREKLNAKKREYCHTHPEYIRKSLARSRQPKMKKWHAQWEHVHLPQLNLAKKKRYATNREYREKVLKSAQSQRDKLRAKVFGHYGAICSCCDEHEPKFLTIDHTNGGGAKQRRELGLVGGVSFYQWLVKNNFPEGFQTLCHNCNSGKWRNGGICPHKQVSI